MTTQTETTAWPEGVIARYLTVGGATVDITHGEIVREKGDEYSSPVGDLMLAARCSGCGDGDEKTFEGLYLLRLGAVLKTGYGEDVREWAQDHAETCRALPNPNA
ncbi:hypothetical protein [Streptomyces sp. NBC_00338]|uniref:hypothetical protein n=1 Tax=Streptomyces sp. NBC_00338 TaxID=2975715 RepID=UPI002257EE34|nr:hypothetical protein [Streptomyces sp. NBC_00338]MCX5145119.1 hypothetical protein [Streptomyces sp. NBC_00338]